MPSLPPQEIDAIARGYHTDPFSVLGPHRDGDVTTLRCLVPWARHIDIVLLDGIVPMERLHDNGLFEGIPPSTASAYLYRVVPYTGDVYLMEDPYRFPTLLSEFDLHLFGEGTNQEAYRALGAHLTEVDGVAGVRFAVWAPHANLVLVTGDFNRWDQRNLPMRRREGGVWELFVPGVKAGAVYKYFIHSELNGYKVMKADPYAFQAQLPPETGSVVAAPAAHEWTDANWMRRRAAANWLAEPMSIYEVHIGSWMLGENGRALNYREIADRMVPYLQEMNYTHVELMPVMEHPFSGSWGYQVTGFFAPTSRHGSPDDFRYFVDRCHQAGIGVILDWVPGHFPRDLHGLHYFDGSFLYEPADPRIGEHKEWGTLIFNYGRNEVQSFLLSSAIFWLNEFHVDGFRVDAVASMLYLDYNRKPGEWAPNRYGGRENLEAISFLRRFNEAVHKIPGAITIAEESTSFPGVSHPTYVGGLGFTMKWNMGWMHDMFDYFKLDPIFRKGVQQNITFSLMYAFSENFVLPISHDEVVHGKSSLLGKMPGDEWRRFANCRAFLAYMYGHPGKKLLFMGQEIGQYEEWSEERSVRWELTQFPPHRGLQELVKHLNRLHRDEPALHQIDAHWRGFEWIDFKDVENSVISFLRTGDAEHEKVVFVCNFTPVPREQYRIGMPAAGTWDLVLNTDEERFGGSNFGVAAVAQTAPVKQHDRPQSIEVPLPPLGVVAYKWRASADVREGLKQKAAPMPETEDLAKLLELEDDPELAYALR